jgi:opacity protein-like surface antigen
VGCHYDFPVLLLFQHPEWLKISFPGGVPRVSTGLTASTSRGGWVLGFGTEFALTGNWSARAETDYIGFGDTNVTASDGSALRVGMHFWEEKIGLNYRF